MGGGGGAQATNTTDPVIGAIQINTSAYGKAIALVYGQARIPGNLIWYNDFTAIPHTTTTSSGGGGKGGGGGGGGSTQTSFTYKVAALMGLCEGQIAGVQSVWADKTQTDCANLGLSAFVGTPAQTAFSYVTSTHPSEALGYRRLAYVATGAYDLGSNASLPNHNFEIISLLSGAGGTPDANPAAVLSNYLTDTYHGAGFPAAKLGDLSAWSNYCIASGIFASPSYTSQEAASAAIGRLAQSGNAALIFSEGILKVVPYADSAVTGNGITYTPNTTALYALTDDDFLDANSDDPVIVTRSNQADAFNRVQVQYANRANQYNQDVVQAADQSNIEVFGLRPMQPVTLSEICDINVARNVAQIILQRSLYIRNTYKFKLGWKYCLLEPMDIVTLTENSGTGLNNVACRITSIEENEDGTFSIEGEDFIGGISSHVAYPTQEAGGYSTDYQVAPGSVAAACIFEPPYALASGTGLEVWAGVSGPASSAFWGGCYVWVSYDGATYKLMATVNSPSRVGHLTDMISPTSTGPLPISLDGMGGQLLSASAADAAALNSLFYVGGTNQEFMAYQGSTLTSANNYTLSGLVRGAYGSAEAPHYNGDPFIRLDDALAKSGSLDLSLVGSTIHLKFQSFNIYGAGVEDISTLTTYNYTISGQQATGNAVTGLVVSAVAGSSVLTTLSWVASTGVDHYVIDQSGDGVTWQRTGETKATTWADSALYGASTRFRVAAVRAFAGTWSSPVFLNISQTNMWNSVSSTPMWNSVDSVYMWS